jgi:hypothetical protein
LKAPRPAPLDALALALATALAAVVYLPRLPPSADGLLRGSRALEPLIAWAASRPLRAALAGLAYLLLGACMTLLARRALAARRRAGWAPRAAGALALVAGSARWALGAALDLLHNAWFAPESLSPAEPALTWLALAWTCLAGLRAAEAAVAWAAAGASPARAVAFAGALLVPGMALDAWARLAYDAGAASLEGAARLPPAPAGFRGLAVLAVDAGKPVVHEAALPLGEPGRSDYGRARLSAAERFLERGRSVYRRAALRFLYSGRAFELDADGLRRALLAGLEDGDPLAATLLLEQAGCAPTADAGRLLAALGELG